MYQHFICAVSKYQGESWLSKAGLTVSSMTAFGTSIKVLRRKLGDAGTRLTPSDALTPRAQLLEPESPDEQAVIRLRMAAVVGLIVEVILPLYEGVFLTRIDWQAMQILAIWLAMTLALLAATCHRAFLRIWKPTTLLFSIALIFPAGIWSMQGASAARFFLLLVLLPVGGACLPWEMQWQAGMSAICVIFGAAFASQLQWRSGLALSGMSAMAVSIIGSHLFHHTLARQRREIDSYVKALSRSEEKFRKIFEMGAPALAIFTLPDGTIVDVNPAWEKLFGVSRSEAIGQSPAALNLVNDTAFGPQLFASLKPGDAGALKEPVVFRDRRNEPVHFLYSWATLEVDDRLCVLVAGQDLTARIRTEEALRRNREAMARRERLTALGELASGVAHDLNNSLNALRLNVELLRGEQRLPAIHNNLLEVLSRIVTEANSTVGRLQDFARRRHDRPVKAVDLVNAVHQALATVRDTLDERNARLAQPTTVELSLPQLPPILGELSDLRQTFLNLLLNGLDAMPNGGAIRISGRSETDAVVVTVEDEGHGIPAQFLDRVFDPFFTTKTQRGTGLGLSIAFSTMVRLGGSITAGNRFGGGAIFTLRFPLPAPAEVVSRTWRTFNNQPRRIMVIDDDANNLEALAGLFQSRGHQVKAANSGKRALQELMREDCKVEVVFCDLGMPEMSGWDVARQVRSLVAPPVFYLLTGWAQEIRADDPRRQWVDAVVAKPVEPLVLDQLLAWPKSVGKSLD
jgi:PAS domain S-box-containing protein